MPEGLRRLPIRRQHQAVEFAVLSPCVVIVALWLWSKTRPGGWEVTLPQALSQVLSLIAIQLFAIVLVIAARSRGIERIYGGLDKGYRTHGKLAKVAFGLMLAHPVLLVPHYLATGQPVPALFWFADFWPRNVGVASWYLFIGFVGLTLWRKVDYQHWLVSHRVLGVPFVLAGVHAVAAASDVRAFEPLRFWVVFWVVLGTACWLYKLFLYERLARRYAYRVESVEEKGGGILDLRLAPDGARMSYEPGEFAFLSVQGRADVSPEQHPFSLASDPARRGLRFGVRQTGDYTKSLSRLRPGDRVDVFGPYGEFTSYNFDSARRQVWIAGGIGVTPFLSMLQHESHTEDGKRLTLVYSVKSRAQAVYAEELEALVAMEPAIDLVLHFSDDEGFLTGERLVALTDQPETTLFLMCGPGPMMKGLRRQLLGLGLKPHQIDFEEFDFV